jgi:uncharacterized membrane protein YdjX (TVP38/TMEM64 family)
MNYLLIIWYTLIGCTIGSIFLFLIVCALFGVDPKERVKEWWKKFFDNKTPK